jgi:putative Holliday junction resolvase
VSRVLGLDFGERRIGVALSDVSGLIASPHSVIDRRENDLDTTLRSLCRRNGVERIVVGLPVSHDGGEHDMAAAAREFGAHVAAVTGCEVVFADERFTTIVAERALLESGMRRQKRRGRRDMVAAAVMLQSYLDGER